MNKRIEAWVAFLILTLTCFLFSCQQSSKEETQVSQEDKDWFFWAADWNPLENQVVLGGSNDTYIKLISTEDFQVLKDFPYKGTITKTKWHPTENKIAISVQDAKSKCAIFDLDTEGFIELDSITKFGARAIGWNNSGEILAVGDYGGYITFFDREGRFIKKLSTNQKAIIGLDWHPDENLIVAVGEKISLYHYEQESLHHIKHRKEEVLMLCVAWHPSGEFFVSGDYGDFEYHYPPLLQYWTYEGENIRSIEESEAEYRNISWSDDGEVLASASEKVRLWDKEGNLVAEQASQDLLWGIDWDKNGSKLVATDEKGRVLFWDKNLNKLKELKY